jgi:hypothetical protein
MPGLLRKFRNIMTLRTARIMANRISQCAPGPTPKTIGIGPPLNVWSRRRVLISFIALVISLLQC